MLNTVFGVRVMSLGKIDEEMVGSDDLDDEKNRFSYDNPWGEGSFKKGASKAYVGGILLILSGVTALLFWVFSIYTIDASLSMMNLSQYPEISPSLTKNEIKNMFLICGSISMILSVFTIICGILAVNKKMWFLSIIGGILGIFTFGFVFISPVLAVLAIIFLFMSKNEFEGHIEAE